MATLKPLYGTSNQAITITLSGLVSSQTVGRGSVAIDNTSNLYDDILLFAQMAMPNSVLANDKAAYVYAAGTADGGTTYSDGYTSSDAGFTTAFPTNLKLVGICPCITNKTNNSGPFSLAAAFGGMLPDHIGLVVINFTGQNLGAASKLYYQGIQYQGV